MVPIWNRYVLQQTRLSIKLVRLLRKVNPHWLVWMLVWLAVTNVAAQVGNVVIEGQTFGLGVTEVPGNTYDWKIYTDYTLQTEAGPLEILLLSANTGPAISVKWLKSGIYFFTVVAQNPRGCMNMKVGMVTVEEETNQIPVVSIVVDKNPICSGTLVTFIATATHPGTNPVYQWYRNGVQVGFNGPTYTDYTLQNKDLINCILISNVKEIGTVTVKSEDISMTVYKTSAAFSIVENIDNMNGKIQLVNESTGADTYYWDFGNGQHSSEVNPVIIYYEEGDYPIMLASSNQFNCADTSLIKYKMLFRGLYIPNAFAPTSNSSPANLFKPIGMNLMQFRIEVYDNWGHLMWESTAIDENGVPTEAWDGTFQGVLMPQGTYMWKVNAIFTDGTVWRGSDIGKGKGSAMGTVTLIR